MAKRRKNRLDSKLDLVLKKENAVLKQEAKIESEEKKEEKYDRHLETIEKESLEEIKELEKLEKDIKEQVKEHPLKKIGGRDIVRGLVGAFAGVIVHNALYYGTAIANTFDITRATIWLVLAFVVGSVLLYATGYRKIEDKKILLVLPVRMGILYVAALIVTIITLFLYLPHFGVSLEESFKQVAAVQMSASIGAVTADLIGRNE